jgi:hypothetical protein
MARIIKPPAAPDFAPDERSVFLAGSIEMGQAEEWQSVVTEALADLPAVILNPRRDAWDASWTQTIHNAQFREQVEWELAAQERASCIAVYFAAATMAPVTLLELGLCARSGKVVVCCPEGFWRKGNVEVVCDRYRIPLVDNLAELIAQVRRRLIA